MHHINYFLMYILLCCHSTIACSIEKQTQAGIPTIWAKTFGPDGAPLFSLRMAGISMNWRQHLSRGARRRANRRRKRRIWMSWRRKWIWWAARVSASYVMGTHVYWATCLRFLLTLFNLQDDHKLTLDELHRKYSTDLSRVSSQSSVGISWWILESKTTPRNLSKLPLGVLFFFFSYRTWCSLRNCARSNYRDLAGNLLWTWLVGNGSEWG